MPKPSGGGGFADILSYKPTETDLSSRPGVIVREIKSEGISEADMQKLIKKSDKIIKSTNKNSVFGLVAVALCGVILLFAIVGGMAMFSMLNQTKAELAAITDHLGISALDKAEAKIAETETALASAKTNLEGANKHLAAAQTKEGDAARAEAVDAKTAAENAKADADKAYSAALEAKTAADEAVKKGADGADAALTAADAAVANAEDAKTAADGAIASANAVIKKVDDAKAAREQEQNSESLATTQTPATPTENNGGTNGADGGNTSAGANE